MPRYKLVVEYDGTPFAGWQRQINGRSVQQVVEEAIERFAGTPCGSIAPGGRMPASMPRTRSSMWISKGAAQRYGARRHRTRT